MEVAQEAMPQTTKVVVAQQATLGTVGTANKPQTQIQVAQQVEDIILRPTELAQEVVQVILVKAQLDTVGIPHGQDGQLASLVEVEKVDRVAQMADMEKIHGLLARVPATFQGGNYGGGGGGPGTSWPSASGNGGSVGSVVIHWNAGDTVSWPLP